MTWHYLGDVRFPIVLGRAFLLQVMHPTIAAGVAEHSMFKSDPWGRLHRSWDPVLRTLYTPDGPAVGARVRAMHQQIKGVTSDGRKYHALEPQAYWWVLATGLDSMLAFAAYFGRPLATAEQHCAVDEVRELGRRFGLRDRDMPRDLTEFRRSFDETVDAVLQDSQTVQDLVAVLRAPPAPSGWPTRLWPAARAIVGPASWIVTLGTLPVRARGLIGETWTGRQEAALRVISAASRTLEPLPATWRSVPVARASRRSRPPYKRPRSYA